MMISSARKSGLRQEVEWMVLMSGCCRGWVWGEDDDKGVCGVDG